MAQPNMQLATPPEVPLAVTLTFAEWQMVVGQLGNGPYQQVAGLIEKISRHVSQRIEEFHSQQERAS